MCEKTDCFETDIIKAGAKRPGYSKNTLLKSKLATCDDRKRTNPISGCRVSK